MLDKNWQFYKENFSHLADIINSDNKYTSCGEIVAESKAGKSPTIYAASNGKKVYLHSKYNPYEEAKRFIDHIEIIDDYEYVLFLGFALGYHVEYFIDKYPDIPFSILEPNSDIFKTCLEIRDISFLVKSRLNKFYISDIEPASEKKLEEFLNSLNCNILAIPLSSYETAFPDEYTVFYRIFGQYFPNTAILDNTKKHNEKLHTVNVLNNFRHIMDTPNIVRESNNIFKNKPAILVSAGPSLEYEIENLRYISEKDLAYIFSAGSAINALIEAGIHPHACLSIDPTEGNQKVYKKLIAMGINTIPLLFGTTASPKVVNTYPGSLLHFITSKDLVSPYYLGNNISSEGIVDTASSVAVVALVLLYKLGFSPIILVGQNLAYKDNRYYARGVDYNQGSGILESNTFECLYQVQSVDGSYVYSDDSLNCFRKDIEYYIRYYKIGNVINTTRSGATIKGTQYLTLNKLLESQLKQSVVDRQWEAKLRNNYNKHWIKEQSASIKAEINRFNDIIDSLKAQSNGFHSANNKDFQNKPYTFYYKIINDVLNNIFFHVFLYSMNVYECKMLIKDIRSGKNTDSSMNFSFSVFERFLAFIDTCLEDMDVILPLVAELDKQVSII